MSAKRFTNYIMTTTTTTILCMRIWTVATGKTGGLELWSHHRHYYYSMSVGHIHCDKLFQSTMPGCAEMRTFCSLFCSRAELMGSRDSSVVRTPDS